MLNKKILIGFILLTGITFLPGISAADFKYIDITSPFLRRVPIAVTEFKDLSGTDTKGGVTSKATEHVFDTLSFTSYFEIIDNKSFLELPHMTGIKRNDLNFGNWTVIGAEYLITGGIKKTGDNNLSVELRFFDTFKQRQLIGKRYKGSRSELRKIIHRFCDEVIKHLSGKNGLFNSKIAFISTSSGNKEVYTCDFDGRNPVKVTDSKSITLSPSWSQDGKWIAYTSYENGKPDLFIKRLNSRKSSVLSFKGMNITPSWIPGSKDLAASLSFSGDQGIYRLTRGGKIIKRLTRKWSEWGIDISPTFSPDGKKMAFVSKRSGPPQIYIKDLNTGHVRRLTYKGRYNTSPSWSPNGDMIAYSGSVEGQHQIFKIGLDGSEPVQLTEKAGDNEEPSWSPDGNMITFRSNREGNSRIYVMTAYGTDQRRLLAMKGEQTSPRWSPNVIMDN